MMNSMLGALVGDAAGATLEFCGCKITEEMALNAMRMPGGGRIRVGPGQITDDGELTLTLWQALNSTNANSDFPEIAIMEGYKDWYESCPFDMGRTCSIAFETFYDYFKGRNITTTDGCRKVINKINLLSEANGALMRSTAIPTWAMKHNLTRDDDLTKIVNFAKEDALLSHPSIVCQETNAIYVFAIVNLLRGKSPQETLALTNKFVLNQITSNKVKDWYFIDAVDIRNLDAMHQIGHVRWGFVMAIYFLRNPTISFEEAIKITLMKGGDTDTNAAIVGGMVGAYQPIPEYMLRPVLTFDCTSSVVKCHNRPGEYSVRRVLAGLI